MVIADRPVLCPVPVGRDEQLRVLHRLLGVQPGPASGPRTVVISGEAGIGKSRLLTELDQLAVQQRLRVVRGRAFEGGRGLPFGLLLDLLRSLLTSAWREEAILRLDPVLADLILLMPALVGWLGDRSTHGRRPATVRQHLRPAF